MTDEDRTLPAALREAHALDFFEDHDGHDFQPDDVFEWSGETTAWWHAWTGNPEPIPALVGLAQRHTGAPARSLDAVTDAACAEVPALTALVESATR